MKVLYNNGYKLRSSSVAQTNYKKVTELWALSREAVRRNLGVFLLINSLSLLSVAWNTGTDLRDKVHGSGWSTVFSNSLYGNSGAYPSIGGSVISAILGVLAVVFALMGIILVLKAAKKDRVTLSEVWNDFKANLLWLRLIGVILLLVLILVIGFVALILPGIYLIGRVILAPYILVDQDTKVFEAIEKSWHLTRDRMWQVYNVVLLSIALSLFNIIPIIGPIISFVLVVSYSVAMPIRYLELKDHRRSPAAKKEV